MPNLPVLRVIQMRPILGENDAVGLETVLDNGRRFVIALSGEGMKALIADIQSFLDDNPHLAEQKSPPRQ